MGGNEWGSYRVDNRQDCLHLERTVNLSSTSPRVWLPNQIRPRLQRD